MFSLTNKKGVDPYDYTNAFDHFFQNKTNFSFPQKAWLQLDHLTLEKSCHFFFGGELGYSIQEWGGGRKPAVGIDFFSWDLGVEPSAGKPARFCSRPSAQFTDSGDLLLEIEDFGSSTCSIMFLEYTVGT